MSREPGPAPGQDDAGLARSTTRAIGLRIMPLLAAAYFVASLDRVNVGFAALQMNQAIGLRPADFGLGAGLFFVSYSLFAIPGAVLIERLGVQRGVALVMIAWGLVSAGTGFVHGPGPFYALRFLLGVAEAAFFPGVILYLTTWLPRRYRGRLMSILMLGLPLASVFGSPVSAALLTADGALGLQGWQWLFLVEGAPAIVLGVLAAWLLPMTPDTAGWLDPAQRGWLAAEFARDRAEIAPVPPVSLWRTMVSGRVLALTMVNIGAIGVSNGLAIWQPQMIHSFGLTTLQTGLLNTVPFALGCAAMYAWSWHSDRTRERRLHTAIPLLIGCLALAAMLLVSSLVPTLIVLCVAITAATMIKSPFWAFATEVLPAAGAAVAFAEISALTNIGAFVGTYGVGLIKSATGSYTDAMLPLMVMMLGAFACALLVGRREWVSQRKASAALTLP